MIKRFLFQDIKVNTSAPNLVSVCVDRQEGGNISGRMYHKYQEEAVPFRTLTDLLWEMERLFDAICFPQASTHTRSFKPDKTSKKEEMEPVSDTNKLLAQPGDLATFVIHVRYRQNATWQGEVVWADTNKRCGFRSALELLKLMDSALEETGQEDAFL